MEATGADAAQAEVDSCVWDYEEIGAESACHVVASFMEKCAHLGFDYPNWRVESKCGASLLVQTSLL